MKFHVVARDVNTLNPHLVVWKLFVIGWLTLFGFSYGLAQTPTPDSGQTKQEERGLGVRPTNKMESIGPVSEAPKPELALQVSNADAIRSVSFSADGHLLATGGFDSTISLWEVATGRVLRTLFGHTDSVQSVAFSVDGRWLASGAGGVSNEVKLWEVATGREIHTLRGHSSAVDAVAFSPDGRWLASASQDNTVKLWEVATRRERHTLKGHTHGISTVAFSPDSRLLASGSLDKTIRLWEVSSGRRVRNLSGHSDFIKFVAFSPDGRRLASGSSDNTVKVWDAATGREVRTISRTLFIKALSFTSDGQWLAIADDNTVKLLDPEERRESLLLNIPLGDYAPVAFSPDGRLLATGGGDSKPATLWDLTTGRELRTLVDYTKSVGDVAFSSDNRWIATATASRDNRSVKIWDITTGQQVTTLREERFTGYIVPLVVAFSPDDHWLAFTDERGVKLVETATWREIHGLRVGATIIDLAFSPDGRLLASGSIDERGGIKLWDVTTGREVRAFAGSKVEALDFSPDGRLLASAISDSLGGGPGRVQLWEVATGKEVRTIFEHKKPVIDVAFSPDGRLLASGNFDGTIKLWDASTGSEVHTLVAHSGAVTDIAFSPDGRRLASGSGDQTIKVWDVAMGRELHTLTGHGSPPSAVVYSPDGNWLVTGSIDTRVWDADAGREVASLSSLKEKNDWVVVTPDGLFDGTQEGLQKLVAWRFGNKTAPLEMFLNEFYYPGLLADIFAGKSPKAARSISQVDRRQPEVKLSLAHTPPAPNQRQIPANERVSARTVAVKVEVAEAPADASRPAGSGARDVRLFRNGSLVKVWHGDVLKGQSHVTLEATIPIVAGENRFTAYAFNRDNIKSSDATLTITGADSLKRKGVAYVLAIGVNEYANSQYNLKYAVADARDFAEETKLQQGKVNNYERVEVVALNDRVATKANILKALWDLSAKIQPEDALVIFFAGHGTAQQNRFYLIPHDLGYAGSRTELDSAGLQSILSHSISDEELEKAVEGIDAGQLLLVIDACNSGQALEAEEKRRGPMNSKGLAQLAYEKGMYILTAAQSYQAAQEASRLGHGFLTYALVEEGLKTNAADKEPKDGQVLLREWLDFATERVPQMQEDELTKQQRQGRQLDRIKFAESDSGNERSVQRPRVFYRRETEPQPLVIARP